MLAKDQQNGGVYHQMPASAPAVQAGNGMQTMSSSFIGSVTMSPRQMQKPTYSFVPQALPSYTTSAFPMSTGFTSAAAITGTQQQFSNQAESFGFNQNEFVQQVVTMSAIKEIQGEEDDAFSASDAPAKMSAQNVADENVARGDNDAQFPAASGLNDSSLGSATDDQIGRSELAAVRVAAGWEAAVQLAKERAASGEIEPNANANDQAVTNEHSPEFTPRNSTKITTDSAKPGCCGMCFGTRRAGTTHHQPANRF